MYSTEYKSSYTGRKLTHSFRPGRRWGCNRRSPKASCQQKNASSQAATSAQTYRSKRKRKKKRTKSKKSSVSKTRNAKGYSRGKNSDFLADLSKITNKAKTKRARTNKKKAEKRRRIYSIEREGLRIRDAKRKISDFLDDLQ